MLHSIFLFIKVTKNSDWRVMFFAPEQYGIPKQMTLVISKIQNLRKNDAAIEMVKQEYEIQMTDESCNKSLEIIGFTDNETYMV